MTSNYKKLKDLYDFITNKEIQKNFNNEIHNKTMNYQKQYGFEYNKNDPKHPTWNNEADAFKHAFMQAVLTNRYYDWASKIGGDIHEIDNLLKNAPKSESNMDWWNNKIGREIAKEVYKQTKGLNVTDKQIEDIYAQKIVERMRNGDLITSPKDQRAQTIPQKIKETFNYFTGQAAPIDSIYTREMIDKMSSDEYLQHEPMIMEQLRTQGIPREKDINKNKDFSDYFNEVSNNSKVFTREEIKNMTPDEYLKNEKAIDYQLKTIGVPYEKELKTKQNTSRGKETNKKSSSSSNSGDGRWVTINGNHVFIND